MAKEEFVMVPVPADRVEEVYEVLGRPRRSEGGQGGKLVEIVRDDERSTASIRWSDELLGRCYRESPPAMCAVFETLAGRPGERVTSEDLATAIGESKDEPGYSR